MGSLKHEDSVFKFPKPLCTPERERKQNRIPLRIAMRKGGGREWDMISQEQELQKVQTISLCRSLEAVRIRLGPMWLSHLQGIPSGRPSGLCWFSLEHSSVCLMMEILQKRLGRLIWNKPDRPRRTSRWDTLYFKWNHRAPRKSWRYTCLLRATERESERQARRRSLSFFPRKIAAALKLKRETADDALLLCEKNHVCGPHTTEDKIGNWFYLRRPLSRYFTCGSQDKGLEIIGVAFPKKFGCS